MSSLKDHNYMNSSGMPNLETTLVCNELDLFANIRPVKVKKQELIDIFRKIPKEYILEVWELMLLKIQPSILNQPQLKVQKELSVPPSNMLRITEKEGHYCHWANVIKTTDGSF